MKHTLIPLLLALTTCTSIASASQETWAYLMKGEERFFPADSPITDVACFSAQVNGDGFIEGGHRSPPSLEGTTPETRYHLVITIPWNSTLAHIYLNPELPFRDRMIEGIVERTKPFDGVQIDFESISSKDGTAYLNFLANLKKALPKGKLFSVAVLPRWETHKKKNPTDAFDYPFINRIADRVIVMAYDEHYSGGTAGPVASLPWCEKIYSYALKTIHPEKLVMGIPLYGRSWQKEKTARAFRNPEVWTNLRIHKARLETNPISGGSYAYTTNVTVQVHFESMPSLNEKIKLYGSKPIRGVAFWRIGQEPRGFWSHLAK
jgi:spore germination protein YaaH